MWNRPPARWSDWPKKVVQALSSGKSFWDTLLASLLILFLISRQIITLTFFYPHSRICFLIERETLIGCLLYMPDQGSNPQPRYVPWPGIEPTAFLVYRTMLQPTEPPCRDPSKYLARVAYCDFKRQAGFYPCKEHNYTSWFSGLRFWLWFQDPHVPFSTLSLAHSDVWTNNRE